MKKLKLLVNLFAVTMMLVGCSNIQKVEEPAEPVEKTQEVEKTSTEVAKEDKKDLSVEKTKVVDPTKYDYWVVVYDQFKNELVRTTAHYGETVEPYPGQVVTVYTNTYIDVYVEYNVPEPEPEVEQEPDCHHSGRAYWVGYADDTTVEYIMFTYDEVDGWVSEYNLMSLSPKAVYARGIPWLNVVQTGDVVHVQGNEYTICDQQCVDYQPLPPR